MKNIGSGQPSARRRPQQDSLPAQHWRALRTGETRIRDLQNRRASFREQGLWRMRLRDEIQGVLQTARSCAETGAFERAEAADLAGMVNNFAKMRQPPVIRDIDAVVALVAAQVVARGAAGSLNGWSARHLAILANGLGKCAGPGIQDALAQLAQALPEAGQLTPARGWSAQPLSMMANSLGKCSAPCARQALVRLARALPDARALTVAQGWAARDLAMMVNGLSKGEGACISKALTQLAGALPAVCDLTVAKGWGAGHLAMLANGLSKGGGQAVQDALQRLAGAVRRQEPGGLRRWDAQNLAMMVNGLSKGEGGAIAGALAHLAQALPEARYLTPASGWNAQPLAMMANGLSKGEGACISKALIRLAQAVPAVCDLTGDAGWSAHHLAMMANGLGKSEDARVQAALQRLARAVLAQDPGKLRVWSPQCLSMMVNGLSKGEGEAVQEALMHLARALPEPRSLTAASGWSALPLAMMANGLSKAEGACIRKALADLAQAVPPAGELTPEAGWNIRHLAMLAHGLGKGEGIRVQEALQRLAQAVGHQPPGGAWGWDAQSLAMMVNGLSKGEGEPVSQALAQLASAVPGARNLTRETGWDAGLLAMLANGLSKAEGAGVQEALQRLAQALCRQELGLRQEWTARFLAMMANALAKGEGPEVLAALEHLARALTDGRSLTPGEGWTATFVAMMANGLGKGEGACVQVALRRLAQAFPATCPLTPEADWTVQPLGMLAMMASGLIKGEGHYVQAALSHLAQAVMCCDLGAGSQGSVRSLALITKGLARTCDALLRHAALARVADVVCLLPLSREAHCTRLDLVMLMETTGQTLAGHALFEKITSAAVERAQEEPELAHALLGQLSRCALAAPHLQAARRLISAIQSRGVRPCSWHERNELSWRITLFHYACQQTAADPALAAFFVQAFRHSLSCPLADDGDDSPDTACDEHWHGRWAADYWQPSSQVTCEVVAVSDEIRPAIPYWQGRLFGRLRAQLPGHRLQLEARINQFPVDILIDERICVEVDGVWHFAEVPVTREGQPDPVFVRQRLTKDLLIDDILRHYGYQVFRIADVENRASLDELVRQIRSALDSPAAERPEPRDARERAASPDQCV